MAEHLWETQHSYYCSGRYDTEHDSWEAFLEEWGDADDDYNLVIRWDWRTPEAVAEDEDTHALSVFFAIQRKAYITEAKVAVRPEDERAVREYLRRKLAYLLNLWEPVVPR